MSSTPRRGASLPPSRGNYVRDDTTLNPSIQGGYYVPVIGLRREKPVEFSVKLPDDPGLLQLDPQQPHYRMDAPETGNGPLRQVIVFRLLPIGDVIHDDADALRLRRLLGCRR